MLTTVRQQFLELKIVISPQALFHSLRGYFSWMALCTFETRRSDVQKGVAPDANDC